MQYLISWLSGASATRMLLRSEDCLFSLESESKSWLYNMRPETCPESNFSTLDDRICSDMEFFWDKEKLYFELFGDFLSAESLFRLFGEPASICNDVISTLSSMALVSDIEDGILIKLCRPKSWPVSASESKRLNSLSHSFSTTVLVSSKSFKGNSASNAMFCGDLEVLTNFAASKGAGSP